MSNRNYGFEDADKPPAKKPSAEKAKGKKQKTYNPNTFGAAAPKVKKPAKAATEEGDYTDDERDSQ